MSADQGNEALLDALEGSARDIRTHPSPFMDGKYKEHRAAVLARMQSRMPPETLVEAVWFSLVGSFPEGVRTQWVYVTKDLLLQHIRAAIERVGMPSTETIQRLLMARSAELKRGGK